MCGCCCFCGKSGEEGEDIEQAVSGDSPVPTTEPHKTYSEHWVSRWHRSTNKTKKIIRHIFSLKPDASLGQEWNDDEASQVSPEYVAVPARMVEKLDPKELELGSFSGDSAQQFRQIYRASRLSAKGRTEPAPGSPPRYQHSAVLRSKPMVHYFNPTCCVEGQPSSPYFEDAPSSHQDQKKKRLKEEEREGRHSRKGGSDVSALTSPTVTAGSVENPLQHSRQSSVNEIFTIYEDSSVVSADSLDLSPRQLHPDLKRILSSTSPVLKKGAYSGFIREQSFSPTKFAV